MFTVNSSGDIMGMKKLEYNPSCIHSFSHKGKQFVVHDRHNNNNTSKMTTVRSLFMDQKTSVNQDLAAGPA